MKRLRIFVCVMMLVLSLAACSSKQAELVGDWVLVQGDSRFGSVLRFTEDGALLFAPALHSADNTTDINTALAQMLAYYEIAYQVKNDKTIELTITIFSASLEMDVSYSQNEDVLIFDDATYRRIT